MIRVTNENWIIWESSLWCRRRDFSRLVDCGVRAGMRDRYSRLLVSRDWDRPSPRSGCWLAGLLDVAPVAKLTQSSDLAYTKPMYSRVMFMYVFVWKQFNTFSLLTALYRITPLSHSVALIIHYFKKSIVYTPRYVYASRASADSSYVK